MVSEPTHGTDFGGIVPNHRVSLYEVLGVAPNAPAEVIRAAYRVLARLHHPDASVSPQSTGMMSAINEAYEVLSDPSARATYDAVCSARDDASQASGFSAADSEAQTRARRAAWEEAAMAAEQERQAADRAEARRRAYVAAEEQKASAAQAAASRAAAAATAEAESLRDARARRSRRNLIGLSVCVILLVALTIHFRPVIANVFGSSNLQAGQARSADQQSGDSAVQEPSAPPVQEPSVSIVQKPAAATSLTIVSLGLLKKAAALDPPRPTGAITKGAKESVLLFEQALSSLGYLEQSYVDGSYGTKTLTAMKAYQKYVGHNDLDGIPGPVELKMIAGATDLFAAGP